MSGAKKKRRARSPSLDDETSESDCKRQAVMGFSDDSSERNTYMSPDEFSEGMEGPTDD